MASDNTAAAEREWGTREQIAIDAGRVQQKERQTISDEVEAHEALTERCRNRGRLAFGRPET